MKEHSLSGDAQDLHMSKIAHGWGTRIFLQGFVIVKLMLKSLILWAVSFCASLFDADSHELSSFASMTSCFGSQFQLWFDISQNLRIRIVD